MKLKNVLLDLLMPENQTILENQLFTLSLELIEKIKNVTSIILDIDDTISHIDENFHNKIVCDILIGLDLADAEITATRFVNAIHNEKLRTQIIKQAFSDMGVDLKIFWDLYRQIINEKATTEHYKISPGFYSFLNICKYNNVKLFIISNSNTEIALKTLNLVGPNNFDEIICLSDKETHFGLKPDPNSFHYLRSKHKLDISSTLYLGNSYTDYDFATGAGINSIMIHPTANYSLQEKPNLVVLRSFKDFNKLFPNKKNKHNISYEKILLNRNIPTSVQEELERNVMNVTANVNMQLLKYYRDINNEFYNSQFRNIFNLEKPAHHYFDDITGSLRMEKNSLGQIINPSLKEFINSQDNTLCESNHIFLRGKTYYFSILEINNISKINLNFETISTLWNLINKLKQAEINNNNEFVLTLGILDNLRHQLVSLYHFLSYPERFINNSEYESIKYSKIKTQLEILLVQITKVFYDYMLFNKINLPNYSKFSDFFIEAKNYLLVDHRSDHRIYKLPEIDNQFTILLSAFGNIYNFEDVESIFFLPSGGTQIAYTTGYLATQLKGLELNINAISISLHSSIKNNNQAITEENLINKMLKISILVTGKNVLVVDDNSNSGNSLQMASTVINTFSPKKIEFSIVEIDPARVLFKIQSNPKHTIPNYQDMSKSSIGVVPITRHDRQLRKLLINHRLK